MKMNAGCWMAVCAAGLLAVGSAAAADGTWVSPGGGGGNDYGRTNNWLNGVIAQGAGATLSSLSWAQMELPVPAANSSTNVVIGHILVPEEASAGTAMLLNPGFGAYGHTEGLVFDSGVEGVPASIRNICVTNKTRMKIRNDIRLQSDLLLSYNPTNQWSGPNTALYLTGNISEDGTRRGLTVSNTVPGNQISLFGDNTFSGDIEVRQGILRAQSYTRLGGEGRQFGRDNLLIATNADSQIDLGGFTFGPDQRLLLAGSGVGGMGVLAASQQSPCYTSVWSGPITLAGDSTVGMGFIKSYPRHVGSAFALAGPIGEEGTGRRLIKNSLNALFLRGTNTYSGGTIISNGYLSATCRENLGTGPLVFAGGAFLFETPWDITSVAGLVLTNWTDVRLRTADQNVTFNGVLGPFGGQVYKSGLGTLTLTRAGQHQNLIVCSGAVNLDYTENNEAKLPSVWYVSLYNNASLNIIGGAQPFTNTVHSVSPNVGCAGVVSIGGAAGTRFNLEGTQGCGVGTGESLDLRVQEGTMLSLSRSGLDASMLNTRITYNGGAFVSRSADGTAIPYASASTDWDTATSRHMDVLADTPAAVPADAKIRTLRFNDPAAGELTLQGDTVLANGALLVTESMGSTVVHIQGGKLTSSQNNELTVHQYNTQAVLRISSVLTNTPTGGSLTLTKTGPGTLVLSDVPNTFSGTIYVIGGTLEIESGQAFGATNRSVYVYNGAKLRLRGQQVFGVPNSNCLFFNEAGGTIDVPDAGDRAIFIGRTGAQSHGVLTKTGKGMLTIVGNWSMMAHNEGFFDNRAKTFVVEEGTLDISRNGAGPRVISGESLGTLVVKNNAVLRGALFLSGNGATNGGGSSEDEQGGYHLRVEATGGIVDLDGVSVNMGFRGDETYSCDFISGPGRLTITNSSATAATASFNAAHFNWFTGVFDGAKQYLRNVGGGVPMGEFVVPEGVAVDYGWSTFPYTVALGRLTGAGSFGGKCPDNQAQPPLLVGRDAPETFEYSGYLWGTYNGAGNRAFPFRYTKVGSNAWRISGTTNAMVSSVTIRKGTILVGADSFGGAAGALGREKVILGDSETVPADMMALLTDGPFTVGNGIVLPDSATGSVAILGGNQTAGASSFTNDLVLTRDVVLTSANTDENGVTFSGAITGTGGITKTGVGTVYLTGVVGNTGPTAVLDGQLVVQGDLAIANTLTVTAGTDGAGALAVDGNLSLGAGAQLAVSVSGSLVRGQTYTILTWTGTRTGTFAMPIAGVPEDWRVSYRSNGAVLHYAPPATVIRVR